MLSLFYYHLSLAESVVVVEKMAFACVSAAFEKFVALAEPTAFAERVALAVHATSAEPVATAEPVAVV